MKKLIPLFLLIFCSAFLWAQDGTQINLNLSPSAAFYNYLNASNFDPEQPSIQPILFSVDISNNTGTPIPYSMYMKLEWSGASNHLFETWLEARNTLGSIPLHLTNQSMIISSISTLFNEPDPSLKLSTIMDQSPEFKDAILHTGRFPDGKYTFTIQAVMPFNHSSPLSEVATFVLDISNANAIYLQAPGVQLGGMVPTLSNLPLTFLWNSNIGGILPSSSIPGLGKFTLTIREFDQASDLQLDNIENGQVFRVIPEIVGSIFSEYIPFENSKYYAWQISTPLSTTDAANLATAPTLKSPWFVFKFNSDAIGGIGGSSGTDLGGSTGGNGAIGGSGAGSGPGIGSGNGTTGGNSPEDEFLIILTNLNNPQVNGILNDGFRPTGNVWVGDQLYSGNSALQQLQGLAGKTIKSITLSNE
jgi:hypothetical protein